MSQRELFSNPRKPRATPRRMMHVIDASGCSFGDGGPHDVRFRCRHCGLETGWERVGNVTEGKRGKPCPKCNEGFNAR